MYGLSGEQEVVGEMALDATSVTLGEVVFGDGGEEATAGHPSLSARSANAAHPLAGRQP